MSYSILYRSIAVTSNTDPNKYIIFSEMGCNNVYDASNYSGRMRRSRTWEMDVYIHRQKLEYLTLDEIKARVAELDFDSGCYAVYGRSDRSYNAYMAVYNKAIKNAMPFSEMFLSNLGIFSVCYYDKEGKRNSQTVNNLDMLFDRFNGLNEVGSKYVLASYINYNAIIPKRRRVRSNVKKDIKNPYVIYIEGSGWYVRSLRNGLIAYTSQKRGAKIMTLGQSTKIISKLSPNDQKRFSVVKLDGE